MKDNMQCNLWTGMAPCGIGRVVGRLRLRCRRSAVVR